MMPRPLTLTERCLQRVLRETGEWARVARREQAWGLRSMAEGSRAVVSERVHLMKRLEGRLARLRSRTA